MAPRPSARRAAREPGCAALLAPCAGTRLPAGPCTVRWDDAGADSYTLLVGRSPGASDIAGVTLWRRGRGPAAPGGRIEGVEGDALTSVIVDALPRAGQRVFIRLWSMWLGAPARCASVEVLAHDARGRRSQLERVAALAMELAPAPLRPRALRRAAAAVSEDDARDARARDDDAPIAMVPTVAAVALGLGWSADTSAGARARSTCTCPSVDPTCAAAWVRDGCHVHRGEPGQSRDADVREARAALDALLGPAPAEAP